MLSGSIIIKGRFARFILLEISFTCLVHATILGLFTKSCLLDHLIFLFELCFFLLHAADSGTWDWAPDDAVNG